ncbi:hypothetical protein [Natronincola peptidivorans]|nr:hypothetical protein [Natronincola peptidivorans]
MKRDTEVIGKIKWHQMFKPNTEEWLLKRINPKCENCNNNDYYIIDTTFYKPLGVLPLGKIDKIIRIICPKCKEVIELDREEFVSIRPFIKINNLFESGKIDEYQYKYRLEKIEEKYH